MGDALKAPFPYFGGKSSVTDTIWSRLGTPKQYIEPFFGSGAVLLAAPQAASLEVVNDLNGFLANFWRATKAQPGEVARWADYPVSHIDLGARHRWLMAQRERLGEALQDPNWPGDAQVAGWWLWGQCCWIGSGWCEWQAAGQVPTIDPGRGVQAAGQVPTIDPGRGVQAAGQVPTIGNAGMGVQALGKVPHASDAGRGDILTSTGAAAWTWLHRLAARLERVRIVHGEWSRCLNHHYGDTDTAVFLDPPYRAFEALYGGRTVAVADECEAWARDNADLRICLAGHVGDYDLPGWDAVTWKRPRLTYAGGQTTDRECLWFSPACLRPDRATQPDLFATGGAA